MTRLAEHVCPFVGRVLLSGIFLASGVHKISAWDATAQQMEGEGMLYVPFFLFGAILCELGGGLSVLTGYRARLGAFALIVFLVPVTLIFHDFWQYEGADRQMQMINFMKNLAILGGLSMVVGRGPGCCSLSRRTKAEGSPSSR